MTQPTSVNPPIEEQDAPVCRHYWVIQPATGPVSQGSCQNCGETREFKNYVEASTWGDDKSASRASADVAPVADQQDDDEDEE
ncbi:MAG: hypothetical protein ACE5Q6_13830 [Dehalococcoidia bacterium]